MHETGKKLFNLMFRPGETVCVSHNKYGYHSIPLENAMDGQVTLVSPDPNREFEKVDSGTLQLVALNPIKGYRDDASVYKYRNFLVEMDYGPLAAQMDYAKRIGLPYSAVIFSGSKSLHFLISLDQDLPSEKVWRHMAEWTLRIMTLADQNTKNPSRSIRIPGAPRDDKFQQLVELKGPTSLKDFSVWLSAHPEAKPKEATRRSVADVATPTKIKDWVLIRLHSGKIGAKLGRNKEWYAIAFEFALAGYSEDYAIEYLSTYYTPESTFKEKEWLTCIHSAFKNAYSRKE